MMAAAFVVSSSRRSSAAAPLRSSSSSNTDATTSSSSTRRRQRLQQKQKKQKPTKTLYEILGADPADTKAELKKKYIQLAKLSHPDATAAGSNLNNADDISKETIDFNEIATAWSILSNPKERLRYDRQLRAEQFSTDIANTLMENARPAADWSAQVLDKLAVSVGRFKETFGGASSTTTAATTTQKKNSQPPQQSSLKTPPSPAATTSSTTTTPSEEPLSNMDTGATPQDILIHPTPSADPDITVAAVEKKKQKNGAKGFSKASSSSSNNPETLDSSMDTTNTYQEQPVQTITSSTVFQPPVSDNNNNDTKQMVAPASSSSDATTPDDEEVAPLLPTQNNNEKDGANNKNNNNRWNLARAAWQTISRSKVPDKGVLLEKAQTLELNAVQEYQSAVALQTMLKHKAQERLRLSLHTAESQITANEAYLLLDYWNDTATQVFHVVLPPTERPDNTGVDNNNNNRASYHNSVPPPNQPQYPQDWQRYQQQQAYLEEQVGYLAEIEDDFLQAQQVDQDAQDDYRQTVSERLVAKSNMEQAHKLEEQARLAYETAKLDTLTAREKLEDVSRRLINTSAHAKKTSYEMERRSLLAEQHAERVRNSLVQFEANVVVPELLVRWQQQQQQEDDGNNNNNDNNNNNQNQDWNLEIPADTDAQQDENRARLQQLAVLRLEERRLAEESNQKELRAAKLLSRANKLKNKVQVQEEEEEEYRDNSINDNNVRP